MKDILKILAGVGLAGIVYKTMPLLEILQLLLYLILVPLALLTALGLVSSGAYNLVVENTTGWAQRLRQKVDQELKKLRDHAQMPASALSQANT